MNPHIKTALIAGVISAATGLIVYFWDSGRETVEAGITAQQVELIEQVINAKMKTSDGQTYGQKLDAISTCVTRIEGQVGMIVDVYKADLKNRKRGEG